MVFSDAAGALLSAGLVRQPATARDSATNNRSAKRPGVFKHLFFQVFNELII